jgi:hypothetical protein
LWVWPPSHFKSLAEGRLGSIKLGSVDAHRENSRSRFFRGCPVGCLLVSPRCLRCMACLGCCSRGSTPAALLFWFAPRSEKYPLSLPVAGSRSDSCQHLVHPLPDVS